MAHLNAFKKWLSDQGPGCGFHNDVDYSPVGTEYSIHATAPLPSNSTIVTLPFSGAITSEVAKAVLDTLSADASALQVLSERQLVCAYICAHSLLSNSANFHQNSLLKHGHYIATLPAPSDLRTPLHWTEAELNATKGSNLYKATLERMASLQQEHSHLCSVLALAHTDPRLIKTLTWISYLTACTYLSSRAFPSTLLSSTPSLQPIPTSYPILLPGIDAANHARGARVTWSVSTAPGLNDQLCVSLVTHDAFDAGQEVFNNYGPKPNAELILGYGFALQENPDDTIVLAIGGAPGGGVRKHEVGREAAGGDAIFEDVRAIVSADIGDVELENDAPWETVLDAADALEGMIGVALEALPLPESLDGPQIRKEVKDMLRYYLEGQKDILEDILVYTQTKRNEALEQAKEAGVIITEEEDQLVGTNDELQ